MLRKNLIAFTVVVMTALSGAQASASTERQLGVGFIVQPIPFDFYRDSAVVVQIRSNIPESSIFINGYPQGLTAQRGGRPFAVLLNPGVYHIQLVKPIDERTELRGEREKAVISANSNNIIRIGLSPAEIVEVAPEPEVKQPLSGFEAHRQLLQERQERAAEVQRQFDQEFDRLRSEARRERKNVLNDPAFIERHHHTILAKIRNNWRIIGSFEAGSQCEIVLSHAATGLINSLSIENCNEYASDDFKESVARAVQRASPFPVISGMDESSYTMRLVFKP